jgi:hypothetical protein
VDVTATGNWQILHKFNVSGNQLTTVVYHPDISSLSIVKTSDVREFGNFVPWLMLNADQKLIGEFKKHIVN